MTNPSDVAGAEARGGPALDPARLAELRSMLGAARLGELLAMFDAECSERPAWLRLCYRRGDRAALAAAANSLSATARDLGARALSDAARTLAGAVGRPGATRRIAGVDEAALAALGAAERYRAEHGASSPTACPGRVAVRRR